MFGLFTVIIISSLFTPSQQKVITVDSSNGNDTLCNQTNTHPCKTLHTALEAVRDYDTIHIHNGSYSHNTNTTLTYNDVNITGDGSDVTIVECENGTGFGFINVTNINISGLTLSGCGQLRNSTTVNMSSNSVMLFQAAVYFENVINVTIDNVVVSNSIGMGVAMYDVTGNVTVTNSIFRNNSVPLCEVDIYPGGGGFSVEFTYCKLVSNISSSCYNTNKGAVYLFDNCTFDHNTASIPNQINSPYASETFGIGNQQFGSGGGLSIFFRGHSIQNVINISNCVFDHNKAVWGGGFHSDIVDYSTENVLTIEYSNFTNNHCDYDDTLLTTGTGGGGARISLSFYDPPSKVTNNSIQFIQCRFQSNRAYYGGGLSCRISKENFVAVASNSLELVNCTWVENIARTGSGVDIISHVFPHGLSPVVKIVNCNFTANSNNYSNKAAFPSGIGALYADSIPVNFSGNCIFHGNNNSAIAGMGTYFRFTDNTSAVFSDNIGWHGAGMALLGNAYFIVHHNTSLQFINNSAVTKGGAIYYINSGQKDFISTQRCLLYYYDISVRNYSNWVTTFIFSGNSALRGKSIYCTTLLTCIWSDQPGNATISKDDILQVFNWNGIFQYDDNSNTLGEIATDTFNISIGTSERVKIPPGQFYKHNITSVDDRNQTAHPVFLVKTNDTSISSVDRVTEYTDNYIKLHGKKNTNITVYLQSTYSRSWSVTINVTLDECPPGFHYPSNDNNETVCKCSTSTPEKLYGVTDCDNEMLVAHLNLQFWAGYVHLDSEEGETFMTSDCPQDYCVNTRVQLPDNSSYRTLDNLVCSHHRTGQVCGKCQSGYYVYSNTPTYRCGPCNDSHYSHYYIIIIVSQYVPLTLMMCFIIFFDISLVDGPLNSFILFCQILITVRVYGNGQLGLPTKSSYIAKLLSNILTHSYDIWNLEFFESLLPPFCVFKYSSSMVNILAEYTPAFYVLLLCLVFFFVLPWISHTCARCRLSIIRNCILKIERIFIRVRHRWSVKNSVIHSLTTFLILSYARITLTTFKLLSPVSLYGPGGQDSSYTKTVVWYDGTMSYFGHEHLPYAIVALFMFITFVLIPPLLLLSYPLLPALMTRLGIQDYWIVKKLIINPLSKCVPIFDAFQSCYKDEYRFFAGLSFVYRATAIAISDYLSPIPSIYIWMQLFFLSISLLHCIFQPYKKKWHNFIEAFTFTLLAAISAISSHRLFEAQTQTQTDDFFWVQAMLLYCPLAYFIAYVSYKVVRWLHPRIKYICSKTSCNVWNNNDLVNSYEFPARMEEDDDNFSTNNESSSDESSVPDDEHKQENEQDENDVEMMHPVVWNDDEGCHRVPRHNPYISRNWVTQ